MLGQNGLLNSQPPRRFPRLAAAIVIAALIVGAAIFAAAYFGTAATVTMTSIITTATIATATISTTIVNNVTRSQGTLVYTSGVSPDGLQLQVTLNSSSIQSHGALTAKIDLLNTLNRNVSLAVVTNQNMSGWDGVDFLCSRNPSNSLAGFALLEGHFSAGNISEAGPPLQLAEVGFYPPCAFILGLNGTTFLPNSDKTLSFSYYGQTQEPSYPVTAEVNATTGFCVYNTTPASVSANCGGDSGLFGYWNPGNGSSGNGTLASKNFMYFPPGEYTILATDDWNQYVYAYFTVL